MTIFTPAVGLLANFSGHIFVLLFAVELLPIDAVRKSEYSGPT